MDVIWVNTSILHAKRQTVLLLSESQTWRQRVDIEVFIAVGRKNKIEEQMEQTNKAFDDLSELDDGVFIGIPDVDRSRVVAVHESDEAVNQVRDVLEWSGLRTIAVNLSFEKIMVERR